MSSSLNILDNFRPPRNRVEDRRKQANRIARHGIEAMAPCSNCRKSGGLCKMLKGNARCQNCTRKNMRCDGQFSEEEYDALERQKMVLQDKVKQARERLSQRAQWYAQEMARLAAQQVIELQAEQKSLQFVQRQLDGLTRRQSDMVVRHSLVLDALDEEDGHEPDVPEPLETGGQPNASPAFDDAQLEALMAFETNLDDQFLRQGSPSALGEFLVPRCFPSRRILTI